MAQQDPRVGRAGRSRGKDELHFADLQHLRTSQPRIARPSCHRQGEDHLVQSRPEKSSERDGEQNSGKRKKRIDQYDVYKAVERAAEISGKRTESETCNSRTATHPPTTNDTRAPYSVRDSKSRPSSSVPIQWCAPGRCNRSGRLCAAGSR